MKMAEMGITDVEEFWKKVNLNDVQAFEKDLDKVYCKYWLRAGGSRAKVAEIQKLADGTRRLATFKATRRID